MLGSGAEVDVPNPGNDVVVPPNRGLGRAMLASSFLGSCGVGEGARLNGSEPLVDGSLEDDTNAGWIDGAGPKLNGAGGGGFSINEPAFCAGAWPTTPGAGGGDVEVVDLCGIALVSDLLTGVGSPAT